MSISVFFLELRFRRLVSIVSKNLSSSKYSSNQALVKSKIDGLTDSFLIRKISGAILIYNRENKCDGTKGDSVKIRWT